MTPLPMPEMTPPETMMYFIVAPAGGGGYAVGCEGEEEAGKAAAAKPRQHQSRAVAHGKKSAALPLRRQQPRRARVSRTSLRVACSAAMLLVSCAAAAAVVEHCPSPSPSEGELPAASFPSASALQGSQLSRRLVRRVSHPRCVFAPASQLLQLTPQSIPAVEA